MSALVNVSHRLVT